MIDWLLGGPLGPGRLELTTPDVVLWTYVLVGVLVTALVARSAWTRRPWGAEVALFAVAVAVLAFAATGPIWIEEAGRFEEGRFVVLVDDSRSMSVLEDGTPRSAQVAGALGEIDLGRSEIYTFGDELRVGVEPVYDKAGSDLAGALSAVADRHAGESLAGIVVITDGIDRGGLRRELEVGRPVALELPGPLTLYQVGEPGQIRDLAVADVSTGGFAFLHSPFEVKAEIQGDGFEDSLVPVLLTEDGIVIAREQATLDASGHAEVTFDVTRGSPGRSIYEVSVPLDDDDAVPANNSMAVAVRVVRDKLRILQVCGAPSLDGKFLRLFLKQDPGVDLVSFFILRTHDDVNHEYRDDELSLIRFPYATLFTPHADGGELDTFDLVIFQNFDWASFFQYEGPQLLGNVEAYVRSGKAFVMMGG
ncbi:MAG: hypothetical protein GY913_34170, partial [Proteobacteria bacterium]|nr:hypothetical protein [Pseudomonadota bacterium]